MQLIIMGKKYAPERVEEAVLFLEHLEEHDEVRNSKTNQGIPVCKICGKTSEEIWRQARG